MGHDLLVLLRVKLDETSHGRDVQVGWSVDKLRVQTDRRALRSMPVVRDRRMLLNISYFKPVGSFDCGDTK
jgi:hypothetical protein